MNPETKFISVLKITKEGVTKEQKAALVAADTKVLQPVLDKNHATTVVVMDNVEIDNWEIAGELVTERRKKGR